jgi:hypothetical protein
MTTGAAVLACAGAVWALTADPFSEWAVVRREFGELVARATGSDRFVLPAEVERSLLTPRGSWVRAACAGLTGEYWNGELARLTGPGCYEVDPEDYAEILGRAFTAGGGEPVVVATGMQGLEGRVYTALGEPGAPSPASVIACGRFAFAGIVNPHSMLSCEGLSRLKGELREDGVLALWLPVGRMPVEDVRRSLATVREVFGRYCLFVYGRDGIVTAGATQELDFARLQEGCRDAAATVAANPADLLLGYVGDQTDLAELTAGARPYRLSHPPRPAAIIPDMAAPDRLLSTACVTQYRLLGPERVSARVHSPRRAALYIGLRGFDRGYTDVTGALLRRLGRAATKDPAGLKAFMRGPYVREDLFAGDAAGKASRTAAVLSALGLQKAASQVLEEAVARGEKSLDLELQLAAAYEGLGRPADALAAYRRALEIAPDSDLARGRLTALLVTLNRRAEARELLEQVVENQPENVPATLMLARLYAESPAGHARCAELASRALELDPGNASAQNLLVLCGSSEP